MSVQETPWRLKEQSMPGSRRRISIIVTSGFLKLTQNAQTAG
jgi:hypothetical protein